MFRFILWIFIIKNFLFVLTQELLPFPTPLQELTRIKVECENQGVSRIKETRIDAINCFKSKGSSETDSNIIVIDTMRESECEGVAKRNECWDPVISKINECKSKRGDTVGNIYKMLIEVICRNGKGRASLFVEGKVCKPSHPPDTCNNSTDILSSDLCKSFKAQRLCEEGALVDCINKEQIVRIKNDLNEVAESLKCSASQVLPVLWIATLLLVVYLVHNRC